ncbi:MAG: GIY-YIG nuclease family protein [bacterium]|nr:GIY-YIG nuclease family protein [bacterium]
MKIVIRKVILNASQVISTVKGLSDVYVYILTNKNKTVLYTGVTNNIIRRIYEHKQGFINGFAEKYRTRILIYYECFDSIYEAIKREKTLKGWKRKKKEELINKINPTWSDKWNTIVE